MTATTDPKAAQPGGNAESSATQQPSVFRTCRFCDAPVLQPKRVGAVKDFCSDRHRAAYREQERQKALAMAIQAMTSMGDAIEQGVAALNGAAQVLARFQKQDRKKKT